MQFLKSRAWSCSEPQMEPNGDSETEYQVSPPQLSTISLGLPKHRVQNADYQTQRLISGYIEEFTQQHLSSFDLLLVSQTEHYPIWVGEVWVKLHFLHLLVIDPCNINGTATKNTSSKIYWFSMPLKFCVYEKSVEKQSKVT